MTRRPALALIAALDRQHAIGRGGQLLWHETEDQKHFRAVTMGCPVIMGRKTWDSLPPRFRPLPGRRNIVVTRNAQWRAEGAEAAASLDDALRLASGAARAFVIGGAELYAAALAQADELVLTEIDTAFEHADAHFPLFDKARFVETSRDERHSADATRYAFVSYRRRS